MSLFQARRKPKRIARDEPDQDRADEDGDSGGPVVRRPGAVKQKSKLRVAFDPSGDDQDSSSAVPSDSEHGTVKRPMKKSGAAAASLQDRLKQTTLREDDTLRPSYSKYALDELRASTPTTPRELSLTTTPDPEDHLALSVESKFGKLPSTETSAIPSATEIAERKARRARLALEQSALPASTTDPNSEDYIPLDAYDSDGEFKPSRMQVGTWHQPVKEKDTRLVKDDENFMEEDPEFTEADGGVVPGDSRGIGERREAREKGRSRLTTDSLNLTSRSAKANKAAQRDAIRAAIDAAEGNSDDASNDESGEEGSGADSADDDDVQRHTLFEQSQTSHALPSTLSSTYMKAQRKPRQPKETTPIKTLTSALGSLRERVEAIQLEKARLRRRLDEVRSEREGVKRRQEHIQKSLEEASEELESVVRAGREREEAHGVGGAGSVAAADGERGNGVDGHGGGRDDALR